MRAGTFSFIAGASFVALACATAANGQVASGTSGGTAASAASSPAAGDSPAPVTDVTTPGATSSIGPLVQRDEELGAGEIVVTANKREQNLNKVGLSISALGSAALAAQRIANVADLAQATPGLTFAPTPTSTPVYTLRGVGFFESTLAAYPDVSLYIDQVPLSLPAESTLTAFDLERVEVLKGPQGTLFGNNATGGAINFVAAKPTHRFEAGAELGYGRFNTFDGSAYLSGPITDTLRARFALKGVNGDAWQRSYTRNDKLGKQDNIAGRLIIDWDATDRLKLSLNLNAWQDKDDTQAPQKIADAPQNVVPATLPLLLYPNAPRNARSADWGPVRPFQNNRFQQATFRGDYDFGFATLTSLTGVDHLKFLNATEGGGTALDDLDLPQDKGHIKTLTQELRLSNGSAHKFRWVVGGNYEHTTVFENTIVTYSDTSSTYVNGFNYNAYYSNQKMNNYAGFANAEFDVGDKLTLKAGVRQTKARRNFSAFNGEETGFSPRVINPFTGDPAITVTQFFNAVYGAIYQGAVAPIVPGGSIVLDTRTNADGTPVNPATYLTTTPPGGKLNESSTSWSAGVDFKPTNGFLFYANVAKGYKAGSFPQLSGAIYSAYDRVKQESLLDYEAGFKAQLLDKKLSINGAAFYYDYQDKQLRAKFVDPIFGSLDRLVNVPKSRITGAELSVDARPVRGLSFSASATYLDAKVRKYVGVIGSQADPTRPVLRAPILASFKGVRLPFSPKFQYAFRADYDTPISASLSGFVGVGINGQTKSIGILTTSAADRDLYKVNSRTLVSADAGVHTSDGRWTLTIYGKNIFNKYYWTNTIQSYDTVVRYAGRPAEYGISVGVKL